MLVHNIADKCNFSLWSPVDVEKQLIENTAFSCYTQSMNGDFTVSQNKLDLFCKTLAELYLNEQINFEELNNSELHSSIAANIGFDFEQLLPEEVDYCASMLDGLVN